MRDAIELPPDKPFELTGRHVLMMFIAFFAVVFAVNFYFLKSALSTHTGIVSVEPYRKGLHYNDRIAAGERQTALGWQDSSELDANGKIQVTMKDASGAPVAGLKLIGAIIRPSTERFDQPLRFVESEVGRYTADTKGLTSGNWVLALEARSSAIEQEPSYRSRRRLWVKP
jgi:nitrogen fixation protein FixH